MDYYYTDKTNTDAKITWQKFYLDRNSDNHMYRCSNCGGISIEQVDKCPQCFRPIEKIDREDI